MSKKTIFLTGATGNIGKETFKHLDKKKNEIKVGVRDESRAQEFKRQGAQVVVFDMDKKETLLPAFRGVDILLVIPPSSNSNALQFIDFSERSEQLVTTIEAAKEAGVKGVLLFSIVGGIFKLFCNEKASENRILFQKQLLPAEEAAKRSGMKYIIAGAPFFQENFLGAKEGVQFPLRDGAFTSSSIYDIGRTLAMLLENPEPHYGRTYSLTGPSLITGNDIAKAFSEVLGKEISYVSISKEEAKKMFLELGMPEWQADGALELVEDYANRHYQVTDHIFQITGTHPRTIKETIQAALGSK